MATDDPTRNSAYCDHEEYLCTEAGEGSKESRRRTMSTYESDLERIARGGALMAVGLAFTNLASVIFMVILGRVLGPSQFGIFVLGFSIFGMASVVSLMGTDKAVLRYIAPVFAMGELGKSRFLFGRIARISLAMSLLVTIIVFLSAELLSVWIFQKPEVAATIRLFSLCIVPFVLSVLGYSALQALQDVRHQVLARNFVEPSVKLAGATTFLLAPGVWAGWPVAITGAAFLLAAIYSWGQLCRRMGLVKGVADTTWSDREMLAYSSPLLLSAVFSLGLFRTDIFFLARFGTPESVGLYGAAFHMANIGVFGLTVATLVFSPYIAASYHNNERDKLEKLFRVISRWVLTLTLPFLAMIWLYAGQILSVYGEQYGAAASVLIILSCGITITNFMGISGSVLTMAGYSRIILLNTVIALIFAVGTCYFLIPPFGMIGAAFAAALTYIFLATLLLVQTYRLVAILPFDRAVLKPLSAAICVLIPFALFDQYVYSPSDWRGAAVLTFLYAVLYFAALNVFRWSHDDVLAFRAVAKRFGVRLG